MNAINILIHSKQPGIRFLRHTLFWSMDFLNYMIVISRTSYDHGIYSIIILLTLPLIAAVTYFILYYLLPLFSQSKDNRKQIALWLIVVCLFLGVGLRLYKYYILAPWVDPQFTIITEVWNFSRILSEILSSAMIITLAITIKLLKNKTELEQQNSQLIEEKKQVELFYLKAQMQPHFLFNTLNTLYSETIQESGKAQQVILRLSNLLRFIIEKCSQAKIALRDELQVIRDFVALEQYRHESRLVVDFKIDLLDEEVLIPPLLFLPLVENSFKHTLNSIRGPIHINIDVKADSNYIHFSVKNDLGEKESHLNGHIKNGIANTRRQLELLFGTDYALEIWEAKGKYHVTLAVPVRQKANYVQN